MRSRRHPVGHVKSLKNQFRDRFERGVGWRDGKEDEKTMMWRRERERLAKPYLLG